MKNKKFLIIGIISAIAIIIVVTSVLLLNNNGSGSYDKPYIPKGFEHTEGTVDEGYVIKHTATGNEFVWVPVNNDTVKFERYDGNGLYMEENDDGLENSVKKYGGFYIARYEAGCEVSEERKEGASQELEVLSKPNLNVYNWISQADATKRAKEMAEKQGFEGVQTRLISAKSWDTTMQWLGTNGIDVLEAHIEYGNFRQKIQKTGSNEEWCQGNIYDLAGNVGEWITDFYTGGVSNEDHYACLHRCGKTDYGSHCPLISTGTTSSGSADDLVGFRVVLYK